MVTNTEPGSIDSAGTLTHRVCDTRGRPAEHEDGHRDEHDEGRATLFLLQGPAVTNHHHYFTTYGPNRTQNARFPAGDSQI